MAHPLSGKSVAVAGRLASLKSSELREILREAGACYLPVPEETADLVVVGEGWLPFGTDGRPAPFLAAAERLQKRGEGVRVIREVELLRLLGLYDQVEELNRLYTTGQLSRILEVPLAELRRWIRSGLIRPSRVARRLAWFDFEQVTRARALARLARGGVSLAKIRRGLEQVSGWFPGAEEALVQMEAIEHGALALRLDDGRRAEPTGQLLLDLQAPPASVREEASSGARELPLAGAAERWFAAGLAAEEAGELEEAALAYGRALEVGGEQAETLFNLGNVWFALGRVRQAAGAFLRAVEADPEYVEAWNNLGGALAGLGRLEEAVSALRRALELEPGYADAHANLAAALERLGRDAEAHPHRQAAAPGRFAFGRKGLRLVRGPDGPQPQGPPS